MQEICKTSGYGNVIAPFNFPRKTENENAKEKNQDKLH